MPELDRHTIGAIIDEAVDASGATAGWILERRADVLTIVGASGGSPQWAQSIIGRSAPVGSGTASMVAQSGQPVAIQPGSTALADEISTTLLGRTPTSLLCAPCADDEHVVGVLQLVDKLGGGPFDFDDVEIATMLATIAAAALAHGTTAAIEPPPPERLGRDLLHLAQVDPARYATLAPVIEALLA